jgi:inosine-uridine nucleoside N-ribohydrolase
MKLLAVLVFVLALSAEPVRLIFDTDMGNDIDDALALAMIHAFESRGEAKLLAVTLTKDNKDAAPFVDIVNHFYGRGNIPIGIVHDGKTPKDAPMIAVPVANPVYPRRLKNYKDAPEAVGLLKSILEAQPDRSVVIVQVGFSTNLARLLDVPGGKDLITKKVRFLSMMAGAFPAGKKEYNVYIDLPAANKLFAEWPTPIVTSGYEIGESIKFPAVSIENDFAYIKNHPVAEAYRNYMKMPYDRQTWDLTAVLYAVRPNRGYFSVSPNGTIHADAEGKTTHEAGPTGRHQYLIVSEIQRARVLEALIQLASEPPHNLR